MRNTLIAINFFNRDKIINCKKNPRCTLYYLLIPRTAVTQQHTHTQIELQREINVINA